MTNLLPITVVVPTLNEEQMLGACLSRLARFAQVVVVDSGSKDRTIEIAKVHGADVLAFEWNGRFPKKRNWTLANYEFRTPWVFFLDADELVPDAFCDELAATLPTTNHVGFWVSYTNWFLGRRLRHGGANRKLALFRVGSGEYERIDDNRWSSLDMEVHEHPILVGSTGAIRAVLEHKDDRGYAHWLAKHNDYSTWEAHRLHALLRATGEEGRPSLTWRQKAKYHGVGRFWFPWAQFFYGYVAKAGFLDGYPGFVYACSKAVYFWHIGVKVRELRATANKASSINEGEYA
jgi:glycosyltransferase involved in cell wall biosynthesis